MSPQLSLFRGEIVDFVRQIASLLRHFNERNLPANLLSASLRELRRESGAAALKLDASVRIVWPFSSSMSQRL
jgi:hypothetical protein